MLPGINHSVRNSEEEQGGFVNRIEHRPPSLSQGTDCPDLPRASSLVGMALVADNENTVFCQGWRQKQLILRRVL